jgi:hypothetical protein
MNIQKVVEKINALPICEDGKRGVREIVEEITGLKLNTPIKANGVYRSTTYGTFDYYVATVGGPDLYHIVGIDRDYHTGISASLQDLRCYLHDCKLVANSLEEYFEKKRNGLL